MPKGQIRKLTGKVSYQNDFYSDLSIDNMLYAVLLRSKQHSGIVTSIAAGDLPDGYYFFTARDVPGNNLISTPYGKVPVFSEGNISYYGQPLGIVVGPDENVCKEIIEDIKVLYDENKIEEYLEEGETKVFSNELAHRSIETGPCFEKDEDGNCAGIDSVFAACNYITEGPWSDALRSPIYTEPNGAICYFQDNNLTVYTPTLWLSDLRRVLCESLNIDANKIIIKKTMATGRGTNNIWYNSIIASQAAVAAFRTGKAVKLVYTREEHENFMETVLPIKIEHKTGVDKNGKILAMQINIDVDAGASNPFIQEILDRLVIGACGCYNPVNVQINAVAHSSSNPPSSIELPLIDNSVFFAVENQISTIASMTGFTPFELKKLNICELNKDKYRRPFSLNYYCVQEVLDAVVAQSDFNRKFASYNLESAYRKSRKKFTLHDTYSEAPLRGIGLSCGYEGCGFYGSGIYSNNQTMEITWDESKTLIIHCPPQSNSIKQIWEHTAASILKIPSSSIKFNTEFNSKEEPLIPESIYSNITIMTTLLKKCCESLVKKIPSAKGPVTIKKNFSSSTKTLWNSENFTGSPFHASSFASAVVEVELDPCTFREKIRGIWIVINGGKILNVRAAESTIKLNIQRVLLSLVEDSVISTDNLHISFYQTDSEPLQIGELVHQVLPSAYTQAISQAIGCIVNKLPLQTDSLYKFSFEALEKAEAESENSETEVKSEEDENIAEPDDQITSTETITDSEETKK